MSAFSSVDMKLNIKGRGAFEMKCCRKMLGILWIVHLPFGTARTARSTKLVEHHI